MNGQVVRLLQGRKDAVTVYSDDPPAFARKWEEQGGDYLHVVDLDGAFGGASANLEVVRRIAQAIDIPVELGGGLRDADALQAAFDAGVARAILGTRACQSTEFVAEMVDAHGGERVAVGIDARDGVVSVKGWTESSGLKAIDFARTVEGLGVETIIYTDIVTDGMLTGPNFEHIQRLQDTVSCQIVASGGVSSNEDLVRLSKIDGLYGAIIGKALYENAVDLARAKREVDG